MTKRELPKHVYRQRNGIYFQRRGWPSQKFESEFGTPEFWREYAGILSQKDKPRKVVARNFGALIDSYRKSPRYTNLKPRTGLDYDKHLDFFRQIMGEANPTKMQRKDVIRLRDANADGVDGSCSNGFVMRQDAGVVICERGATPCMLPLSVLIWPRTSSRSTA